MKILDLQFLDLPEPIFHNKHRWAHLLQCDPSHFHRVIKEYILSDAEEVNPEIFKKMNGKRNLDIGVDGTGTIYLAEPGNHKNCHATKLNIETYKAD